jgi:hypothetical protein
MGVSILTERHENSYPDSIELTFPTSTVDSYHVYDVTAPFDPAHADAQMLVLWGNSATNLRSAVNDLPNVQLVQTLAAVPMPPWRPDLRPTLRFVRGGRCTTACS